MRKIKLALFIITALVFALLLGACVKAPCEHADLDANGECDKCGEALDLPPSPPEDKIPDVSGISLPGKTVTYNGERHSLDYVGTLPAGVYTIYEGNGKTVAGIYTVNLRFYYSKDGELVEIPDSMLSATLEIKKAKYEFDGVYFEDKTVTYNGEEQTVDVVGRENLPAGITYTVKGEKAVNVGEYDFTLEFSGDYLNYEPVEPKTATLKIVPASVGGITFGSKTFVYDGDAKSIYASGVPDFVSVDYVGNGVTDAGEYDVTAIFTVNDENYNPIAPITVKIRILKKEITLEGVNYLHTNVGYNGKPHSIAVENLPDTLTYTLSPSEVTDIGEYKITVTFMAKDEKNYIAPAPVVVDMKISMSDYVSEGFIFEAVNGGYAIVGYEGTDTGVIVPEKHNGLSIVSIASGVFDGHTEITFIKLPGTITNIGNRAFYGCTSLKSISLGEEVKVVGQMAFANTAITEIHFTDKLEVIGFAAFEGTPIEKMTLPFIGGSRVSSNTHLGFIFGAANASANSKYITSLTSLTLTDGASEIPAYAFMGLSTLREVKIGRTVNKIGISAFMGCDGIRDIYVPSSVKRIDASATASASPFYGCNEELMIVFETGGSFGKYFLHIDEEKTAFAVYGKTYEDYLLNKDTYHTADFKDATLAGIFLDGKLIDGFSSSVYDYTITKDINKNYGTFSVQKASDVARISATVLPSLANGYKYSVTVVSGDESVEKTYTVTINVTGSFGLDADITVKNGANGTVVYVVDDGFVPTNTYVKKKLAEISNLAVSFAVYTKDLATLETYVGEDGITRYKMDENGKYVYTTKDDRVDFWRDILQSAPGRTEIVSHTFTHATWGYNDLGGSYINTSNSKAINQGNAPEGNLTKEFLASKQVILDLFAEYGSRALAMVTAGTTQNGSDYTLTADTELSVKDRIVRLTAETPITNVDGKLSFTNDTVVLYNPINVTFPAGTVFTTLATVGDTLPAGTIITIVNQKITLPQGTVIPGYSNNYYDLHEQFINDGELIGSRLTGGKIYTADTLANIENRMKLKANMITCKTTNDPSAADAWIDYIDKALLDGGIASFCIHAIVDDVANTSGEGGHYISKAQADRLFGYTESLGDRVWVATLTDAMLYYFEWSTAKLTSAYEDGKITLSITDEERDDIYDMPLTVRVRVPGTWSAATDGTNVYEVVTDMYGYNYILVDVKPETSVTLTSI